MIEKNINCFHCGTIKSMKLTRYSANSWHGTCSSCGRIFRVEEITDEIKHVIELTKNMVEDGKS